MSHRWLIALTLSAGLLAGTGCSMMHKEKEEEANEVKMKFTDVPAAVQKTLTEQAGGIKIDSVDKETGKDGKVVYETDVKQNGKEWEIRVAEDGKLISKKEEKGDKD